MPRTVTLPTAPLGPHALVLPGGAGAASIDASCGAAIEAMTFDTLEGTTTTFKAPLESYAAAPYAKAEAAYCASDARCSTAADCASVSGGRSTCYVREDWRWSTKTACSPSAAYNQRCGCCVAPGSASARQLPTIAALTITCAAAIAGEEAYVINVAASGVAISASSPRGASYALATLGQLMRWDSDAKRRVLDVVPLLIADAPQYPWRGYMLDTSRHFIPVDEILAMVAAMHAARLNVFHWHVVDSPSYPLDSAAYPELAQEGSWSRSPATIYSRADVAAVVKRGAEKFVEIVIEIDTPAHTLAVSRSHPEMVAPCWEWMANGQYKVDVDSDDCMALDPTNIATRTMVATLLQEVAVLAGEEAKYIHIGGDEVKFPCWNSVPAIAAHVAQTYGNTSDAAYSMLQAEWTANVSAAAVVAAGKIPVLWQPTTEGPGSPAWDGVLPNNTVYMIWLNSASAASYANAGSDVVYTTPFYVAGDGTNGWIQVYNAKITPPDLSDTAKRHILGAEVCMWGESMGSGNVAMRSFGIGAAAAENFWLPDNRTTTATSPGHPQGLGIGDRYNRFLCHIQRFGVVAPPIMPSYCAVVEGKKTKTTKKTKTETKKI